MELKKYMKMKLKQVAQVFINLYLDQIFFMRRIIHLLKIKKTYVSLSNAYGGFSNSWGGVCLPMFKDDFKNWPILQKELVKYYKSVSEILNLKSDDDDFNKLLNLNNYKNFDFDLNFQGQYILNNLKRYKVYLTRKIYIFPEPN